MSSFQSSSLPQNALRIKMAERRLPLWVVSWILFSSVICTIDAMFVLLRPRTLPGGSLNYLFKPYNIYIEVDTSYKDLSNGFVIGQSWMNIVEVIFNIITLIMHKKSHISSHVFGLAASAMTSSKTALFLLMSTGICHGTHYHENASLLSYIGMILLPNGIWISIPLFCAISLGCRLIRIIEEKTPNKCD